MQTQVKTRCKQCESDNIEHKVEIYLPINREPSILDIHEAIQLSDETGQYYCNDCVAIVDVIVTLF